jgi:DNA-binding response OmpR family regulator
MSQECRPFVLVVDDDLDDQTFIKEAFRKIYPQSHILYFGNGQEVIEFLSQEPRKVDLILLDLNMPILSGWDALKNLKSGSSASIPVVILTTSRDEEDRVASLSLGASGFYTKPGRFDDIVDNLRAICTQWIPMCPPFGEED